MRTAALLAFAFVLALPLGAAAQAGGESVRVLFIPGGTVPGPLRARVQRLLASNAVLASYDEYARAARQRNLRPSSSRAISRIATEQNVAVIVVASYGGHYRRRILRMRYYNGETGELATSSNHGLRGMHLRPATQHAILRDLNAASGGRIGQAPPPDDGGDEGGGEGGGGEGGGDEGGAGDDGGLPPPVDWGAEDAAAEGEGGDVPPPPEDEPAEGSEEDLPLAEQSQWSFAVAAGAGIMQRSASIPLAAGPARLSTTPFPAIQVEVVGSVRPDPTSRWRVGLNARYTPSVGLIATEERADGSTRSTDLRAQHVSLGLGTYIPLGDGARPPFLQTELGWQLRVLDSEVQFSLPDYSLTGLYLRVGLWFTIGESPISIGVVPEVGHMAPLGDGLTQMAMASDGFMVGGEAHIRLRIIDEVALQLSYREAHAFLATARGSDMNDEERFVLLRVEYLF